MAAEIPKWESELWSYVSSGDGEHCPLRSRCQTELACSWCPDENKERINQFLEQGEVTLHSCDFIETNKSLGVGRLFLLVELMAQKYLKMGRVNCPPVPTGIVSLADEQRCIEIHTLPLKAYHGAIWRLSEEWVIQLRDGDTSARKRFALFHETFHILAHGGGTPVFRKRGALQGSFNELLADHFALCILLPRQWIKEKWAEVRDLDRMAEIFDAPKSAVCIRLRQLGLV